jgi:hypothetical protein
VASQLKGYSTVSSACCLLRAGFLLDILFNPEDGGDVFFRSICSFSQGYDIMTEDIIHWRVLLISVHTFQL